MDTVTPSLDAYRPSFHWMTETALKVLGYKGFVAMIVSRSPANRLDKKPKPSQPVRYRNRKCSSTRLVCFSDLGRKFISGSADVFAKDHEPKQEIESLDQLPSLLEQLKPRSRIMLEMRYGLIDGREWKFREIADCFSISTERAVQIVNRAQWNLKRLWRLTMNSQRV